MILDAYGKPVRRGNTLMATPDWLIREYVDVWATRLGDARVVELRDSILPGGATLSVARDGDTIRVRQPRRYR